MPTRRLGCLSATGIIAAVISVLVVVVVAVAKGGVLFSPGPLNAQAGEEALGGVRSHADIGGECGRCHAAPWSGERMADRCLQCHTDVGTQLQNPETLHGALTQSMVTVQCRACHPEHRGPTAPLTVMDTANFPHDVVGFSLAAHQTRQDGTPFACADCHGQDLTSFNQAVCADCHRDLDGQAFVTAHTQLFGEACLACHDGVDTYGRDFDHNAFFKLEGKHAQTACSKCHLGARSLADLQATPQQCYDCHAQDDAHAGEFGTDCAACHNPVAWDAVDFDHSKTNFPLDGKHAQIECTQCHVNNRFKGTPTACVQCHEEPTYHFGLFGTDCAACHTTQAWRPAKYNEPHTFPINHGNRRGNTCNVCHPDSLKSYTCYGCHEHNPDKIRRKHLEEGISNFQNCVKCHPTGREHEGGDGGHDD